MLMSLGMPGHVHMGSGGVWVFGRYHYRVFPIAYECLSILIANT